MSHSISSATASVVSPRSSGSVIGVACRYSTFGFSAKTAAPATAAARDPVSVRTIQAIAPAASANDGDRDRDRRRAGAIEGVDLHRERVQQMRQRQPHGADLLPPGRDAVDDAARDDEVAARVVVAEREAEPMVVTRDDRAADRGGQRERPRRRQPARAATV